MLWMWHRYILNYSKEVNNFMKNPSKKGLIEIKDFIDFNYCSIIFDITDVSISRDDLLRKLEKDYVNHLWELDNAKYIAIANCDLQGFECCGDIYFDTRVTTYTLANLVYQEEKWFYYIVNTNIPILD